MTLWHYSFSRGRLKERQKIYFAVYYVCCAEQIASVILEFANGSKPDLILTSCSDTKKLFFTREEFSELTSIRLFFFSLFHTKASGA
jgi:hypothetical protein